MLDPAIQGFFKERKEQWLKTRIKMNTADAEKVELEQQADEKFTLELWLPDAAKRAKQLSLVSHPGKFSHSSAKTTSIIANCNYSADGFLRTANVDVDLDVVGNAAALDVHKFLSLKLADRQTVLVHLEKKTDIIREQLSISGVLFTDIEQGLLAIKKSIDTSIKTSEKVKQVYFPVKENEYHLLSILTPSSIMFKLKERINTMRFSDEAKQVREARKNGKYHERDFSEIYGLSVIGYGGTKPQNISVLNSQNGGTSYSLSSIPPELTLRNIRPPKTNFFTNSLWFKNYKDDFQEFHNLLIKDANNIHIRKKRDWFIRSIIYQVADQVWKIRSLEKGWSDSDNHKALPHYQKIWLDQLYVKERMEGPEWFDSVQKELSRWFVNTYKKLMSDKALALGDEHMHHIKSMIIECDEALL